MLKTKNEHLLDTDLSKYRRLKVFTPHFPPPTQKKGRYAEEVIDRHPIK